MNTSRVIHKGHVGVCFGSLTLLTIIAMGLSLLGCQSDAQKMHNGKARVYQGRYSSCMESVVPFSRYAGFGFVEEKGVCQCNEKICRGNETCAPYGACNEPEIVTVKPECTAGEKICISSTMGQICSIIPQEDPKWGEPIVCTGGDVCNSQMMGEYICTRTCSVGLCREVNGIAYHQDCTDETYETEEPIKCGTNDGKVSCIDHTTCGECLNDTVRCEGDNGSPEMCINGQWTEIKCISCEKNECYNHQYCVKKIDNSGYEVLLTTDKGKQRVKEECQYGCNGVNCADSAVKPACDEMAKNIKCDINALEVCNDGGWNVERLCEEGCNPERTACNHECTGNEKRCKDGREYHCADNLWVETQVCSAGCDGDVCKKEGSECSNGAVECKDNVLKICSSGNWENTTCGDKETCNADLGKCQCNPNATKCESNREYRCVDGQWDDGQECPAGCNSDENICNLECSCGNKSDGYSDYKVYCQFGGRDRLVQKKDNANNVNLCIPHDTADYYFCGNKGESVTSKRCCTEGDYYCFNGESYYCSGGKFESDSDCGCDGVTNFTKNETCSDIPPECREDYHYICAYEATGDIVKQCSNTASSNCELYEENDKKVLVINYSMDDQRYEFKLCGNNNFSVTCNGAIASLYASFPEMEKSRCDNGDMTLSPTLPDCECISVSDDEAENWYYMMVDESLGRIYNTKSQLYLNIELSHEDTTNHCSVTVAAGQD